MFSETRYAMNGDLHVAYRTSGEGERDIVFVPNWFTCCEILPELPSLQGWVEAMASIGRLIFFDQPGTGVSDPATPGALPTLRHGTAAPLGADLRRTGRSASASGARVPGC
jgi:pimeloyl-ACP methyl ester carboxylesterase